ncbi:DegQ family serine endoprotease [Emcibacter sp. SYSU 3D8]|uniref:DegQ family serine endoprotease n=1 Tax=Emcibacter sp. SYSU 3D8 TaxID=3133969 RepID=UPI0031FEF742
MSGWMSGWRGALSVVVMLAVGGAIYGSYAQLGPPEPDADAPAPLASPAPVQKVVPADTSVIEYSYAPLMKRVAPAVVNIYTTKMVQTGGNRLFNDPFFRQFFGDRYGDEPQQKKKEQNSLGSGVIVRADGLVVTNHHVIDGADEIFVVLNDRREFKAKIVADEARLDLAVLKIESAGLPFLQLRDSDTIEVGDVTFAIGNPFGIGQTVTQGIVSAVGRASRSSAGAYEFFIQTDAAINPGNSGGALVGLDGTLFGVNTWIYSPTGSYAGISFAIPANMVKRIVDAADRGGKVLRPWFGATGQVITSDLADSLGLDRPGGVLINAIYPGGPADKAGLQIGDVLTEVEGRLVDDPGSMISILATHSVGGKVEVEIVRDRKTMSLRVPLVAAPEVPKRDETMLPAGHLFAGAKVANMSPALADELQLDIMARGVIVLAIERGSSAHRAGLRPGDFIVSINDKPVKTVAELNAVWAGYKGVMNVKIKRQGQIVSGTFRQ